ncbi:PEPxxWA-CTERM sorting domain-containing protein [Sphingomonas floccifaciens]|uniref:PEPxxWA-CTERM sorting domain-containing protein n=1 Tax=Sphingomonas floccifaciens TaxID=1844115 RepID=A0ABW4NDA1_9SPHN
MRRTTTVMGCIGLAMAAGVMAGVNPSVLRPPAAAEAMPSLLPAASAATPAISLMQVLMARSPGRRGHIHVLTKVKASPLAMTKARGPRVSSQIVRRPPTGAAVLPTTAIDRIAAVPVGEAPLPIDDIGTAGIDFSDIIDTPAPSVAVTPGQPGGSVFPLTPVVPLAPVTSGEPTTPLTPAVPPVQTAVPEPATWAMMLLGFGAIGASLRRRTGRLVAAAA